MPDVIQSEGETGEKVFCRLNDDEILRGAVFENDGLEK